MPDVDALIQEYEASLTSRPPMAEKKKSAATVAKAGGMFVKKIIEIYEMKNGKTNPRPLDGRQADARVTVKDKRRPEGNRGGLVRTVQTSKKAAETREVTKKRKLADVMDMTTTANLVSRQVDVQIERNDDNEEGNDLDDVKEELELTAVAANLHVNTSSSTREKEKIKERNKGRSSRKLRGFLCKFNRSGSKRMTKRYRLVFSRQDEPTKGNGRIFPEPSPLSKEFVPKCGNAAGVSSPCAAGGNSRDAHAHDVSSVAELQDDSGNSYKNLQIDMFDFEDEGLWSESRDFESDDNSLSIESVDQFLPNLDRRNRSDETVETTYLVSSSFEDESNASDRANGYDESTGMTMGLSVFADAKNCLEHSTKVENGYPNRGSKLQQIFTKEKLKKILSLFSTKRYFKKKTKSATGKAKYSWRLLRKSQRPILSPDSGFDEHSVPMISSSTLPTSLFPSEKSTCNDYDESTLTFRTFRPQDSLPRESVSKSKRRLVLNESSHEELTGGQDESSCAILNEQTETSYCDIFLASSSPSSKVSTSLASSPRSGISPLRLKYSYLSQKIPRCTTFLSLTRVDELSEGLDEQLDVSELRANYSASLNFLNGWMSSSPYQVCNEPRWRSTPTLANFAKELDCHFYEAVGREKSRVQRVYRDANRRRNVPSFGCANSPCNITGSTCFATVKPRNWRPYMRPEKSRSHHEETDDIKSSSM